jgi:hypothetical protein
MQNDKSLCDVWREAVIRLCPADTRVASCGSGPHIRVLHNAVNHVAECVGRSVGNSYALIAVELTLKKQRVSEHKTHFLLENRR